MGYSRIFKSSAIMGGVSIATLFFGMVRTKFAALMIGPVGIGLLSGLASIQGLVSMICSLGLHSSAVREIALKNSESTLAEVANVAQAIRRVSLLTGMLGAAVMLAASSPLSAITFGNNSYTQEILQISLAVFLGTISAGQLAVIQGMRRIGDLAILQILQAGIGTVVSVLCYWLLGLKGVALSLVILALLQYVFARHYAKRIVLPTAVESWKDSIRRSVDMAGMGFAMMWGGLLASVVTYASNMLIFNELGSSEVGIFSAAFTLSGMLINFILNAMCVDYYPKLSEANHDHEAMRRLVNQQTEIGLLLAVPGLLGTMMLAPWLIRVLYTGDFLGAVTLIHWFTMGALIKVVQWPMGFVQLALGRARLWFGTETFFAVAHLSLITILLGKLGLEGVAIAFLLHYIIAIVSIKMVAAKLIGFKWSAETRKLLWILLPVAILSFGSARLLSEVQGAIIGSALTFLAGLWSIRELASRLGTGHRLVRTAMRIPVLRWLCK